MRLIIREMHTERATSFHHLYWKPSDSKDLVKRAEWWLLVEQWDALLLDEVSFRGVGCSLGTVVRKTLQIVVHLRSDASSSSLNAHD